MRWLSVVLAVLLVALQYRLWFGSGGLRELSGLRATVAEQKAEIQRLSQRNDALEAEVRDLKTGLDAVEERARSELGMIKNGETFYQVVQDK